MSSVPTGCEGEAANMQASSGGGKYVVTLTYVDGTFDMVGARICLVSDDLSMNRGCVWCAVGKKRRQRGPAHIAATSTSHAVTGSLRPVMHVRRRANAL